MSAQLDRVMDGHPVKGFLRLGKSHEGRQRLTSPACSEKSNFPANPIQNSALAVESALQFSDLEGLQPDQLAALATEYRRERAAWEAGPRAAEVRRRLNRVWQTAAIAAEAMGELRPADLALAGVERQAVAEQLNSLDRLAAATAGAVDDLDERGAGKGGRRRLAALYRPPPRFRLAVEVAALLDIAGVPLGSAERGALHDATLAVLHLAGEDGAGLPDRLREVLAARRANRASTSPVCPCPDAAP